MQLRDLEYFAAVAEHGHVGRAAEALGLSQPAVSKSLRRLQTSVQAKLVTRTAKGVELTPVGSALRAHVHRLRLSLDDITREIADMSAGHAGSLRVGAGAGIAEHLLPAACSALLLEAPKLALSLTVASNAALLPALRNGEQDLVVSGIPPFAYDDLVQEPLYDDTFVVYASANHRLARRKRLTISDLARERWALSAPHDLSWDWLHRLFEQNHLPPPRVAFQTTATLIRAQAVASSDLLSFSPRRMLKDVWRPFPLVILRVKDVSWTRAIGLSYRKGTYIAPVVRRMIQILKSQARELASI